MTTDPKAIRVFCWSCNKPVSLEDAYPRHSPAFTWLCPTCNWITPTGARSLKEKQQLNRRHEQC